MLKRKHGMFRYIYKYIRVCIYVSLYLFVLSSFALSVLFLLTAAFVVLGVKRTL